jgi:hypothetical protein
MSSTMRLRTGDHQLYVAMGAAWAPYGGPRDEDIFLTFGVAPRVFFGRLLKIVSHHEAAQGISLASRTRIAQSCAKRLCSNSPNSDRTANPARHTHGPTTKLVQSQGMCTRIPPIVSNRR